MSESSLLYSFGTHGDIQPYIALGRSLIEAEHEAAICTAESYRAAIDAAKKRSSAPSSALGYARCSPLAGASAPRSTHVKACS